MAKRILGSALSRREFIGAAIAVAGLSFPEIADASLNQGPANSRYTPPHSLRSVWNFNLDWTFFRADAPGADQPAFDDSHWENISLPHSFNDVDSFRELISHGGGDRGTYKGLAWYRKRFQIPADMAGQTILLEFEGMRQAGAMFLNGHPVGLSENGVTAYGLDITPMVHFGSQDNVLAVKLDNRIQYEERATGVRFEWNANDFNPDHGGIDRNVRLHALGPVHQTLPLYDGLGTTGTYVYGSYYDIPNRKVHVTVESQVENKSKQSARVELSAVVVNSKGTLCARIPATIKTLAPGQKAVMTANGLLTEARFWSTEDPALYDVYSLLRVDGLVVDVVKTETGFRKTEFKGGVGTGGVYVNEKFVYLKGFAQRSSNEWAGVGGGYPNWLHDYTATLMKDTHANYVRWMHVSPKRADADALCRQGIIQICPAGDKEHDPTGRQWQQRLEVMRASMIYFRNNPSILFWEAGNTVLTPTHLKEMIALRNTYDLHGGRVVGTRGNSNAAANIAVTDIAGYYGVMVGEDPRTDRVHGPNQIFRGYSIARRDRAPLIENEDYREECGRRFWDEYSPPYFGFKKGPRDEYQLNADTFALGGITRYWQYWQNRISNHNPEFSKWSGYASIFFSDSDSDGRQQSSEVCRVSGKVDAMRLPKDLYFCHRVMQNTQPDMHILGHWSYPTGTVKTIYVIANTASVELFVNGRSHGVNSHPVNGWVFAFPAVAFEPGTLRAAGSHAGAVVAKQEISTAGPPAQLRLTPMVGPLGLQADGQDVALIDVEVLDAQGNRCPTDDARVDFTCTGPAVWRGGYNSGKLDSTNNLYLNTELGINRVAVRASRMPGTITVSAQRPGLTPAEVKIASVLAPAVAGLAEWQPPRLV